MKNCLQYHKESNYKKASEYDQEIPQTHPADPMYREEEQLSNNNHKTPGRQSKSPSFLFPIKISATLERTQSNAQQNREQTQSPIIGSTTKQQQQQQNHHLRRDSSQSHWGAKMHFTRTIALDSVVKTPKMLSSHRGFLTTAMYHHSKTM